MGNEFLTAMLQSLNQRGQSLGQSAIANKQSEGLAIADALKQKREARLELMKSGKYVPAAGVTAEQAIMGQGELTAGPVKVKPEPWQVEQLTKLGYTIGPDTEIEKNQLDKLVAQRSAMGQKNQSIADRLVDPLKLDEAFTKTGDEFLKYLKKEDWNTIKGIANYHTLPSSVQSTRFGGAENLYALASQYKGEPIDENRIKVALATRKDYDAGGKSFVNVRSLNTVLQHVDSLWDKFSNLDNAKLRKYNTFANWVKRETSDQNLAKLNLDKIAVVDEVSTLFKGTGGTDEQIKAWKEAIDNSQSKEAAEGMMDEMLHLIKSRLDAIKGGWESAMGNEPHTFLFDKSLKVLNKRGYNENMEKVGGGTSGQVQPGIIEGGYRFKGGNPADQNNWEAVR